MRIPRAGELFENGNGAEVFSALLPAGNSRSICRYFSAWVFSLPAFHSS